MWSRSSKRASLNARPLSPSHAVLPQATPECCDQKDCLQYINRLDSGWQRTPTSVLWISVSTFERSSPAAPATTWSFAKTTGAIHRTSGHSPATTECLSRRNTKQAICSTQSLQDFGYTIPPDDAISHSFHLRDDLTINVVPAQLTPITTPRLPPTPTRVQSRNSTEL